VPDIQADIAQDRNAAEFLGDAGHPHGIRPEWRNGSGGLPAHRVRRLCTFGMRRCMSMFSSPAPDEAGHCGLLPHLVNFITS
jgi:hypothetical protein